MSASVSPAFAALQRFRALVVVKWAAQKSGNYWRTRDAGLALSAGHYSGGRSSRDAANVSSGTMVSASSDPEQLGEVAGGQLSQA
jgi:hypothetical protein